MEYLLLEAISPSDRKCKKKSMNNYLQDKLGAAHVHLIIFLFLSQYNF